MQTCRYKSTRVILEYKNVIKNFTSFQKKKPQNDCEEKLASHQISLQIRLEEFKHGRKSNDLAKIKSFNIDRYVHDFFALYSVHIIDFSIDFVVHMLSVLAKQNCLASPCYNHTLECLIYYVYSLRVQGFF